MIEIGKFIVDEPRQDLPEYLCILMRTLGRREKDFDLGIWL